VLTDAQLRIFERDGVLCVRALADRDTVEVLRRSADRVTESPRPVPAEDGSIMTGKYLWMYDDAVLAVLNSLPLARMACELVGSEIVHLVYDEVFMKAPRLGPATPWHRDQRHWPLEGRQLCSIWLALDHADARSAALRYLAGSHRERCLETGAAFEGWAGGAERTFALQPGDAVVHHAMTVHGSYVNTDPVNRRRAYVTRWAGSDVRFVANPGCMSFAAGSGMVAGAPLGPPFFPAFPAHPGP
jgi:ectoine hydroxylase-related dioxygenase (phytanoyl-CoA dioxygenase family)